MHPSIHRFYAFALFDQVRLVEFVSALNLLAWAAVFWLTPEVALRDSYVAFQSMPTALWAAVFALVGLAQCAGMIVPFAHAPTLRFLAMSLAAGCWATITVSFLAGSVSTTANANYALLTLATAISGGFLGWKTSSSPS